MNILSYNSDTFKITCNRVVLSCIIPDSSMVEHTAVNRGVVGSSPIGPIDYGWIPEWPKGADCKSVGTAFEGSNPSPST